MCIAQHINDASENNYTDKRKELLIMKELKKPIRKMDFIRVHLYAREGAENGSECSVGNGCNDNGTDCNYGSNCTYGNNCTVGADC